MIHHWTEVGEGFVRVGDDGSLYTISPCFNGWQVQARGADSKIRAEYIYRRIPTIISEVDRDIAEGKI